MAGPIQRKLLVNSPGDEYEQEANRIAEQVMRMPEARVQRACACAGECPQCRNEPKGHDNERLRVTPFQAGATGQLAAQSGAREASAAPGQSLDAGTRRFMESRFGHDFSRVRIHTSGAAEQSARALNAKAYTMGNNVVFGASQFAPDTSEGRRLLAHELAHVVQQTGAGGSRIEQSRSVFDGPATGIRRQITDSAVQRQVDNDGATQTAKSLLTVTVWLNAFIPKHIKGLTRPVPKNPGKTMIPGPASVSDCFLTDQRDFDATLGASSRMTSVIAMDVTTSPADEIAQVHDCTETHEVDCEDGEEECVRKGSTSRMKFSDLKGTSFVTVRLKGASNNPCFSGSPDIDYTGKITIDVATRTVHANMLIDEFPAFEMYAAANNSTVGSMIFREPPPAGNTPGDLFGDATRSKTGSAKI